MVLTPLGMIVLLLVLRPSNRKVTAFDGNREKKTKQTEKQRAAP